MINAARKLMLGALAFFAVRVDGIGSNSSGTTTDRCHGAVVDSGGNYIAIGHTQPSQITPSFVAKFDPSFDASPLWQRRHSLSTRFYSQGIGIDGADNIYISAQGYESSSPELPHLLKYNSSGVLQWQRKFTHTDSLSVDGPVVASSGDCYLSTFASSAPSPYSCAVKYNSSGVLQWQRKFTHTYRVILQGLAPTPDGGIVLCGYIYDGADSSNNSRGVVLKINSAGVVQWQYKIHLSVKGQYFAIAADGTTGDIYIAGYTTSSGQKGLIVKLDSDGSVLWHKISPSAVIVNSLFVDDSTGNLYAYEAGEVSITCFDPDGVILWARVLAAESVASVSNLSVYGNSLIISVSAQKTGAGYDFTLLRLPKSSGGSPGTYGHITTTDPGAVSYATGSITSAAAGISDAAGSLSDAAGIAVDEAHDLTFYSFP